MANVASRPCSTPHHRHGTHFMATFIFCIPWTQCSQSAVINWTRLHLQSWCDPFPPDGWFLCPSLQYKIQLQQQGSFQLPVLEHVCLFSWICCSITSSIWIWKGLHPTWAVIHFIFCLTGPLFSTISSTDADRDAYMALAVTRLAAHTHCIRCLPYTAADERTETWGWAECTSLDYAYHQGSSIVVGANSWRATYEGCLVCWFHYSKEPTTFCVCWRLMFYLIFCLQLISTEKIYTQKWCNKVLNTTSIVLLISACKITIEVTFSVSSLNVQVYVYMTCISSRLSLSYG